MTPMKELLKDTKSFSSAVKSGRIKQPTQIGYKEKDWEKSFEVFENISEQDEKLFLAGLWFHKYLSDIRAELKKFNDKVLDPNKLRQMYVAVVNRDFCVADTAILDHFGSDKDKEILMGEIPEKKLPTGPNDFNIHIFGAIESSVSAVKYPIAETFDKNDFIKQNIDDLEILKILQIRINLASTYALVSDLWGECLWNKWSIDSQEKVDLIIPPKLDEHFCRTISLHRFDSLNAEFSYHAVSIWDELPNEIKEKERNKKRIVSINKKGKKKILKLGPYENDIDLLRDLSMSIASEEQYWDHLLAMPLPKYPAITIRDMMRAWEILSSLGRAQKSKLPIDTGVTSVAELLQFAPKLRMSELIIALKKATGFSHEKALSIINLCLFSGNLKDDPWIKPLVPLDKNYFCSLVPSLIVTNRIRLIESWMKEGGIELDKRGYAFEEYIRQKISRYSKASKYMQDTLISTKPIILTIADQEEEIDFVWLIGSLILIGEIKCSFFPTSPLEFHNFFNLLDSAVNQVKRKVDFVKSNLKSLFEALKIDVPENKNEIVVSPVVITNLPYGSGFPINNVPITDLRILIRYMEGYQKFFISKTTNGGENSTELVFYKSCEEAKKNILSFLNSPPNIKLFKKFMNSEFEPLLKFQNRKKGAGWLRLYVDESKIKQG